MAEKRGGDRTELRGLSRADMHPDLDGMRGLGGIQGQAPSLRERLTPQRVGFAVVMVVLAAVSFFFVAAWASSPETYASTISTLDEKKSGPSRFLVGSTGGQLREA